MNYSKYIVPTVVMLTNITGAASSLANDKCLNFPEIFERISRSASQPFLSASQVLDAEKQTLSAEYRLAVYKKLKQSLNLPANATWFGIETPWTSINHVMNISTVSQQDCSTLTVIAENGEAVQYKIIKFSTYNDDATQETTGILRGGSLTLKRISPKTTTEFMISYSSQQFSDDFMSGESVELPGGTLHSTLEHDCNGEKVVEHGGSEVLYSIASPGHRGPGIDIQYLEKMEYFAREVAAQSNDRFCKGLIEGSAE
jgi:hypothetical protein